LVNLFLAVLLFSTPPQEVLNSVNNTVKVNRYTDSICTGWVVNTPGTKNTYVLTAKHCHDDATPKDDGLPTAVIEYNGHIAFIHQWITSNTEDFMLLEIDKKPLSGFIISSNNIQPAGKYYTISHPSFYQYIYSPIIAVNMSTDFEKIGQPDYDAAINCLVCTGGTSGAPVLLEGEVYGIILAKSNDIPGLSFISSSHKLLKFMNSVKSLLK